MLANDRELLERIREVRRQLKEGGSSVSMLPIVHHERKLWFLDERLSELRNIRNPHDSMRLNEFELEFFRRKVI